MPTGTLFPTIFLTCFVKLASISGNSSETAAPWLAIKTPSQGPWFSNISIISEDNLSYASLVIVPIGPVLAYINGTRSKLYFLEASIYPEIV